MNFDETFAKVENFFVSNDFQEESSMLSKIDIKTFLTLVLLYDVDEIIESGVYKGYSTKVLNSFGKKFKINVTSFEFYNTQFLKKLDKDFRVIIEDSYLGIPKLLSTFRQKKNIAILIDGPKRSPALSFSYFLCNNFNNIKFCYLDDIGLLRYRKNLPNLLKIKELSRNNIFDVEDINYTAIVENKKKINWIFNDLRRMPINPFFFNFFYKIKLFKYFKKIFKFYYYCDTYW